MSDPRAITPKMPFFAGSTWTPEMAEALRAALDRLRAMTPEEVFQASVQAGIYSPDGQLRPPYADEPEETSQEARRPPWTAAR